MPCRPLDTVVVQVILLIPLLFQVVPGSAGLLQALRDSGSCAPGGVPGRRHSAVLHAECGGAGEASRSVAAVEDRSETRDQDRAGK
jgi:hypothetical protein